MSFMNTALIKITGRFSRMFSLAVRLYFLASFSSAQADDRAETIDGLIRAKQIWMQSALDDYVFTVQKTCFCPLSVTLPIQFTIENNQVSESQYDCSDINFIRAEPLCDEKPGIELNQTVDNLFQIIDDAIEKKADSITVEYNQSLGYPVSIFIDFIELAVDDEVSYQVSRFKSSSSGQFTISTASAMINHQWKPVAVGSDDSDKVVFYSAPSSVGGQHGVVRMRMGFRGPEFRFQEWSNLDGVHVDERIGLVAISKGHWRFGNQQLEVGITEISGTEQWHTVKFSKPFNHPPHVIAALQTANGGDAASLRIRNITTSSMQIQLVEEDSKKFSGHVIETAGYLLVASQEPGFEVDGGTVFELLSRNNLFRINHHWQEVAPGYKLRLEEDQTVDNETVHVKEKVDVIRINNVFLSQIVSDNGNDNAVLRSASTFEDLKRKKRRINNLVADKSCDNNQQCKEIAFGTKPCGGPWSYLIYSTRQTDEVTLNTEVASYNELQRVQNEKDGAVSDCSVVTPGFPVCSNNLCVAGDQAPLVTPASQLIRFTSDEALETFIKKGLKDITLIDREFLPVIPVSFSPAPTELAASNDRFSTTNIQETGVDEADYLKTDGRYLYVGGPDNNQIRVLEMQSQPYRTEQKSLIDLDTDNTVLNGLYLLTKRINQQPDVLITIQTGYQSTGPVNFGFAPVESWYYPWFWMNQNTEINVHDVSHPDQPKHLKTMTIDGSLLASRLLGESLYLVTRYVPDIQPDNQQAVDLQKLIQQTSLSDLLPTVSIGTDTVTNIKQLLVTAQQSFLPPAPENYQSTDLLTVSRFDLGNLAAAPKTITVIGNSDTIYVSTDALYLATSFYGVEKSMGILDAIQNGETPVTDNTVFIPQHTTQIHKITLASDQPEYTGSATVEGLLTGNDDQRRFRLSEYNEVLRVVTTGQWGVMGEHRITLLRENQTGNLEEISHLPNSQRPQRLGKPNEQLHAVRFVDGRLFLVTFLQVDPLIAVNLSDISDPKIEGELEIPGYSDYLHPINENLLLGIGKHAVPAQGPGDGRFAWFQGIRVGLFDISTVNGPKELDSIVIGERSSESEILYDIHAFSFLPADQQLQQPFKFTVPISVFGKAFPGFGVPDPTAFPDWSHTGLYLFEVDTADSKPALKNRGAIKAAQPDNHQQFQDSSVGINRAVLLNDGVFYSHNKQIWSADWLTPEQAIGPQ